MQCSKCSRHPCKLERKLKRAEFLLFLCRLIALVPKNCPFDGLSFILSAAAIGLGSRIEHGLAAAALRNSGIRALGPLGTYKGRQADLKKERQQTALRHDPVLAGASFVATVSNLSPRLPPEEWQTAIERLASEYGVDAAAHQDAIERLRRR
jgi:hypothetical protein